jgi:hypothetical protein
MIWGRISLQSRHVNQLRNQAPRHAGGNAPVRSLDLSFCAENDGLRCFGLARLRLASRSAICDCLGRGSTRKGAATLSWDMSGRGEMSSELWVASNEAL